MRTRLITLFCLIMLCTSQVEARGLFRKMLFGVAVAGAGMAVTRAVQSHEAIGVDTQRFTATVVGVSDGDTIVVQDANQQKTTIRLRAVDAPETVCHALKANDLSYCVETKQPYGKEAKAVMADWVMGRQVDIVPAAQNKSHGRTVADVVLNGEDINLKLVKYGYAWHTPELAPDQHGQEKAVYAQAMREARAAQMGLWQDPNPVKPSLFRQTHL